MNFSPSFVSHIFSSSTVSPPTPRPLGTPHCDKNARLQRRFENSKRFSFESSYQHVEHWLQGWSDLLQSFKCKKWYSVFANHLIVWHLSWVMNYRGIGSVSICSCYWFDSRLILRDLSVWFWLQPRSCGYPFPSTSHLGLSYHFLVSSVLTAPHLFLTRPTYFFLHTLSTWYMLGVY